MAGATPSVANKNFSPDHDPYSDPDPGPPRLAFAALLLGSALLAFGPLLVRMADTGPVASAFWRLALALPVLLILARREVTFSARPKLALPVIAAMLGAGVLFAADLASWHIGIGMTKMANATLFGNSASIILAIWAVVIARRWPQLNEGAALLFALAGAALLMGSSYEASRDNLIGDLFCLLAGIFYAAYVLLMQRARDSAGSWEVLTISTAAGALPLLAAAWLMQEAILPHDWTPLLILALSSQILGQGLLIYALPYFSGLVIGLALLIQPAMAALIGWASYGERLALAEIIGAVLVGAALVLARLPSGARAPKSSV